MGLISGLVMWPLAPVRGVSWIGEQILEEAERQWYDPVLIQQQLEELEELREQGFVSDEEARELEESLVQRLIEGGDHG